ncbi:MAG TPA: hypothetical protein VH208_12105, partial [Myxococcaceae bacterium]|nr:hypothetical protein [Myxococcaceae bacterium]
MASERVYPGLRRTDQLIILVLAVIQFVFWNGPIWRRFAHWDSAIGWSYLSIPVMVGIALVLRRHLHWLPWVLHSVEIAGVKFGITASTLVVVMMLRGAPPPPASPPASPAPPPTPLVAPVPKVMERDPKGGTIAGGVHDAAGAPRVGWVWVTGVALPATGVADPSTLEMTEQSDGLFPAFAVVEAGQQIEIHSTDGRLHTARVVAGTHWLFNIPVPAQGESQTKVMPQPGDSEIGCTVHGRAERPAHVLVLDHPFFARTDPVGR